LGLVGIPTEKVEVEASRRPRPRRVAEAEKRQQSTSRRPTSERSERSKKGSDGNEKKTNKGSDGNEKKTNKGSDGNEKKTNKAGKADAQTRRPQVSPEVSAPRLRGAAPGTAVLNKRSSDERKRAASRESQPERLQRLGLVGIPRNEAGQSGTRRLTRSAQPEADDAGAAPTATTAKRAPVPVRTVRAKKMPQVEAGAESTECAETERMSIPRANVIQENESMAAMDEDVRRMLEWAAAEAAHTRRVATRANFSSEGAAHYSVARIRETTQGRLANRLRAATLNRARQARQAMQSMFRRQDGLHFRTPGMMEATGDIGEAFAWGFQPPDERPEDSIDEELSQDDAEESASFLTLADRQRIGEVLAEQERRRAERSEIPSMRPRTVDTMWPSFSPRRHPEVPWSEASGQPDRHRPPSRGGESWQPLGQTTPPAYEQVTPELLQLWQIQETQLPSDLPPAQPTQDEEAPELPAESSRGPEAEVHPFEGERGAESGAEHAEIAGGHEIPDAIDVAEAAEVEASERRTQELETEQAEEEEEIEDAEFETFSEGEESDASADDGGEPAEDLPDLPDVPDLPATVEDIAPEPSRAVELEPQAEEIEVASLHSSEDLGHFEEVEVTESGGFHADEWIVEVASSKAAATSPPTTTPPEDAQTAPPTVSDLTEEVIAAIMEELINDTIQSSTLAASAEPALWHPTPVAPPFIDIFNEDSAPDGSSAESEPVVQPSPRRPLPQQPRVSASAPGAPVLGTAMGAPSLAPEELSDAGGRQSKDSGPPRPPSPPPDARSLAVTTVAPTFQAPALPTQASSRIKGKQEQADLISQELLEMLLGEALQEFEGACNFSSPVEEARVSIGSSGPSPLIAGPKPIDTSEAVVGPFVDAAFQHFGVVDETQPVAGPVPPVEEWLPSVKEIMRSKAAHEDAEEESPEDSDRAAAIEGFTRLLADALLEIASEEVKEQGPRVMGWRRPCFGEAPLSRFREKQAQEGLTSSQKQTWEKVRAKLTEQVRFGWRTEAAEETSAVSGVQAGRMTIDLEAGAAGALALANLDEGIDALLEEEICSDEASWLDIKADVQKVKNEVARMIFQDLLEELADEIARLWSAPV